MGAPLLILEDDLREKSANDAFYHHFKVESAETVGRRVYDLGLDFPPALHGSCFYREGDSRSAR